MTPPANRSDRSGAKEVTLLPEAQAELVHAQGAVDLELAAAIAAAARLPLQNERLRVEHEARAEDLRAIRARIVAAADGERRRLERDLHDGAQQRLATLAVALEVARLQASARDTAEREMPALAAAQGEVRSALRALREIAGGLVPPVLADEGLAQAVAALAETAAVRLREPLPAGRFAPEIEATAYHVVTEAVRRSQPETVTVRAACSDERLTLTIDGEAVQPVDLVALDDRVGSLGGILRVTSHAIAAEFPCA